MTSTFLLTSSYGQFKFYISLIEELLQSKKVTILVLNNSSLSKFYEDLNTKYFDQKLKVIPMESSGGFPLLRERLKLLDFQRRILNKITTSDIYFIGRGFGGAQFFCLDHLKERNTLHYLNAGDSLTYHKPISLREVFKLLLLKIRYGRNYSLGSYRDLLITDFIPDSFISKYTKEVVIKSNPLVLTKYSFGRETCKVLLLYLDLFSTGDADSKEVFKEEISSILDIIGKYFSDLEIDLTYHPGITCDLSLLTRGHLVDNNEIPAELLVGSNTKVIISLASTALTFYSRNYKRICLLDLVTWKDQKVKEVLRSTLLEYDSDYILFPKDLNSLDSLLKET